MPPFKKDILYKKSKYSYDDLIIVAKDKGMNNLFCINCGTMLLSYHHLYRYLNNFQVFNEGCVINPKIINDKECYRVRCNKCFVKKHKRLPKGLNISSTDLCYIFNNIDENDILQDTKKTAMTLENLIKKYGVEEANKRWESYCLKQSITNTFEYKKEKYGWTKEQFNEFNKSRAVTEENMIKKYGEEDGKKKFENYCDKQKYVGCAPEYFIEKYGQEEGIIKYKELLNKKLQGLLHNTSHSKISQNLFNNINKKFLNNNFKYFEKNEEYKVFIDKKFVLLDFYDPVTNKCIEFNGDLWHANPLLYNKYDTLKFRYKTFIAKDIWYKDNKRYEDLKRQHNIDVLVIWENDYRNEPDLVLNKCLDFLNNKHEVLDAI